MTSSTCLTGLMAWARGKLLLAAGVTAGALALAACGGSSAPASSGKVTLTFWSVGAWHLPVGRPLEQEPSRYPREPERGHLG